VFARLGHFLLIVTLLAATNTYWAVLQSVAWTTMLADNLQRVSFAQAVTRTFDGKHPCCLCKAIAAARKSEKKNGFPLPAPKLEFPPLQQSSILIAPSPIESPPPANAFADSIARPPLRPPPRGFLL